MGTIGAFSTVDRNTAPFFAFLKESDVDVPSGKIPSISPFFRAFFAFFIVDGAKLVRSVGINPYNRGTHIKYHSIV